MYFVITTNGERVLIYCLYLLLGYIIGFHTVSMFLLNYWMGERGDANQNIPGLSMYLSEMRYPSPVENGLQAICDIDLIPA